MAMQPLKLEFGSSVDQATLRVSLTRAGDEGLYVGDEGSILIGRVQGNRIRPNLNSLKHQNGTLDCQRTLAVLWADQLALAGRLDDLRS